KPTTLPFWRYSFGEYGTLTPTTSLPRLLMFAGTSEARSAALLTEFFTVPLGPPPASSLLLEHPARASEPAAASDTAVTNERRDSKVTSDDGTDLPASP